MLRWNAIWLTSVVLLWTGVVVSGMTQLTKYAYDSGEPGESMPCWPDASSLVADASRPTLVMFAHPRCPCTRASISELAVLMARAQDKLDAKVAFFRPQGSDSSWTRTDLWSAASIIPNVQVVNDEGGNEFRRFGATTSGHVLMFGTSGELLFQGGITGARGHAGDNLGRDSILQLLDEAQKGQHQSSVKVVTPVFGCPLSD